MFYFEFLLHLETRIKLLPIFPRNQDFHCLKKRIKEIVSSITALYVLNILQNSQLFALAVNWNFIVLKIFIHIFMKKLDEIIPFKSVFWIHFFSKKSNFNPNFKVLVVFLFHEILFMLLNFLLFHMKRWLAFPIY